MCFALFGKVKNMKLAPAPDCFLGQGFSAVHVAAIAATCWILFLNAIVGFQILDDGTAISIGLFVTSALIIAIGTGYIALDTAFDWTGHFESSWHEPHRNIGLYVLYQLFPLCCLFFFFVLEAYLVVRVLGEVRPLRMSKQDPPFPFKLHHGASFLCALLTRSHVLQST